MSDRPTLGTVTTDPSGEGRRLVNLLRDAFILEFDQAHEDGQVNFVIRESGDAPQDASVAPGVATDELVTGPKGSGGRQLSISALPGVTEAEGEGEIAVEEPAADADADAGEDDDPVEPETRPSREIKRLTQMEGTWYHRVLCYLRRHPETTSLELADEIAPGRDGTIGGTLSRLHDHGYVERDESTRPYVYWPTEQGTAWVEEHGPHPESNTRDVSPDTYPGQAIRYLDANGPTTSTEAAADPVWEFDRSQVSAAFSKAWHAALLRYEGYPREYELTPHGKAVLESFEASDAVHRVGAEAATDGGDDE